MAASRHEPHPDPWLARAADCARPSALVVGKNGDWIVGAALAVLLIGSVMAAVHHAELVALWLERTVWYAGADARRDDHRTVADRLADADRQSRSPGLARDTVHAVVMLVLNGLAGICIVAGTLRHREQEFQTLGANAFLAVLMPMAMLVLVMPNYTTGDAGADLLLDVQLIFVGSACFALYLVFLFVQTVRHQDYFVPSG